MYPLLQENLTPYPQNIINLEKKKLNIYEKQDWLKDLWVHMQHPL